MKKILSLFLLILIGLAFATLANWHGGRVAPQGAQPISGAALPNAPAALPNGPTRSNNWISQPVTHNQSQFHGHEEHGEHHFHHNNYGGYFYPNYVPSYVVFPYDTSYVSYTSTPDNSAAEEPSNQPQASSPTPSSYVQASAGQQWLSAQNGNVPDNAVLFQSDAKGNKFYYCQAQLKTTNYFGVLVPGDACYVQDQGASIRFTSYQVLVQQ